MIEFRHFYQTYKEDKANINRAFEAIKEEKNSNKTGYYHLPDKSLLLINEVQNIHNHFSQIAVVGIGGSSLGIKAIYSLLKPLEKNTKENLF